jgi:hypothetical protein
MDRDEHIHKLKNWIDGSSFPVDKRDDLKAALYAFSELSLFDGESIDAYMAFSIWDVVETVRKKGFPSELRM